MTNKTPGQLSFKFALRARAVVKAVVLKRFKIYLPSRTISWYLFRWGFTAHGLANMATVRHLCLNLIRNIKEKSSLKVKHKTMEWNDVLHQGLNLIFKRLPWRPQSGGLYYGFGYSTIDARLELIAIIGFFP